MAYRCMCCGTEFDEPAAKTEQAYHGDGIFEPLYLMVCPVCGIEEQYFESLEDNEEDD